MVTKLGEPITDESSAEDTYTPDPPLSEIDPLGSDAGAPLERPKILTLDDIDEVHDLETATVFISEWGGAVRIRALERGEIKRIHKAATDRNGKMDLDRVEQMMVCWASIEPKFNPPAYAMLAKKNAGAVSKMLQAIAGLSGVDDESLEAARANFRD